MEFEKAKSRAYARLEENYQRKMERVIWVGIVLIALYVGIICGALMAKVTKTETLGDTYYLVGTMYSPDSVITEDGNIFCVTEINIDPFTRYLIKLCDKGTETIEDDEILQITPIWD